MNKFLNILAICVVISLAALSPVLIYMNSELRVMLDRSLVNTDAALDGWNGAEDLIDYMKKSKCGVRT